MLEYGKGHDRPKSIYRLSLVADDKHLDLGWTIRHFQGHWILIAAHLPEKIL